LLQTQSAAFRLCGKRLEVKVLEDVSAAKSQRATFVGGDGDSLVGDIYGNGPTLVLLHGGGQSRTSWRIAANCLANAGYSACALDLRGHGDSDWSPVGDYRIERHVADLVRVVEALGAPAIMVGASFGGHVALLMAARRPELVSALVLCDVTPWIEGEATRAIRKIMGAAGAGFASVHEAARHIDLVRGYPTDQDPDKLGRHMRLGPGGRLYWRWDPRFFSSQEEESEQLADLLTFAAGQIKIPVMLIRAGLSEIVTKDQVSHFVQWVPHAALAEIAGARHTVTTRDNEPYASAILQFLKGRKLDAG
jgi:pimeloyl-ACP methyl ester carboxylesterase